MVNVVFNTAFVGDLLLNIPLLKHTRRIFATDRLVLVCKPGLKDFFLQNNLVDEVIELDKKSATSRVEFFARIHKLEIRNLICVHRSFRSAWLLKGVRAQNKIGYKSFWNFMFFNKRVERGLGPEALRALKLLSPVSQEICQWIAENNNILNANSESRSSIFKWSNVVPEFLSMKLDADFNQTDNTINRFQIKKPFVILAPSSQWVTKRWIPKGFAGVAEYAVRQGLNVYLVGTSSEKLQCDELQILCAEKKILVRSLASETSLIDLQHLFSQAEYLISNDSGPMHMAAVAGCPTVAIFGPTTLDLGYRPWNNRSAVVQLDLSCRPCGKHGHNVCPIKTHDCMKKIDLQDALNAINSVKNEV